VLPLSGTTIGRGRQPMLRTAPTSRRRALGKCPFQQRLSDPPDPIVVLVVVVFLGLCRWLFCGAF
jgi:hypothetical protein